MSGFGGNKTADIYGGGVGPGGGGGGSYGEPKPLGRGGVGGGGFVDRYAPKAGAGPPKVRQSTPRGQMAFGKDSKPPIQDLPAHVKSEYFHYPLLSYTSPPLHFLVNFTLFLITIVSVMCRVHDMLCHTMLCYTVG